MKVKLWTDGGVRTGGRNGPTNGKSGRGAIGYVIRDENDEILTRGGMELDGLSTVNECEYSALIAGLYNCHRIGATEVTAYLDSQLVTFQMDGTYACRDANLKEYQREAQEQVKKFETVEFVWIRREENQLADAITREILKS